MAKKQFKDYYEAARAGEEPSPTKTKPFGATQEPIDTSVQPLAPLVPALSNNVTIPAGQRQPDLLVPGAGTSYTTQPAYTTTDLTAIPTADQIGRVDWNLPAGQEMIVTKHPVYTGDDPTNDALVRSADGTPVVQGGGPDWVIAYNPETKNYGHVGYQTSNHPGMFRTYNQQVNAAQGGKGGSAQGGK